MYKVDGKWTKHTRRKGDKVRATKMIVYRQKEEKKDVPSSRHRTICVSELSNNSSSVHLNGLCLMPHCGACELWMLCIKHCTISMIASYYIFYILLYEHMKNLYSIQMKWMAENNNGSQEIKHTQTQIQTLACKQNQIKKTKWNMIQKNNMKTTLQPNMVQHWLNL